jgi:type IV pilus assembly protein PilB
MDETLNLASGSFARWLITKHYLNSDTLHTACLQAKKEHQPLLTYLVKNHLIDSDFIATQYAHDFDLPIFDLNAIEPTSLLQNCLPEKFILKHRILPLYYNKQKIFIVGSNPSDQSYLTDIKFMTGLDGFFVLVSELLLSQAIENFMRNQQQSLLANFISSNSEKSNDQFDENIYFDSTLSITTSDESIISYINKIIYCAIKDNASDIHFEPYENYYRIRSRIDGILHELAKPPLSLASRLTARIKIMAKLDITERRIPQDGRFKMHFENSLQVDFRVSTCPTIAGEKIVLRILDPLITTLGIDELGLTESQHDIFLNHIQQPQGMIIVTGPTGSGKTVTLYSGLQQLNTSEVNIITIEEPVEVNISGINQVNINNKTGLTFAATLRALLRQDPDIMMIGEMRDLEATEIAVKAAQTGHLVLSTLHTNTAAETLTRLMNMGLPLYNIATSVSLIIAQRLARKLCNFCKIPTSLNSNTFLPVGCAKCYDGYSGRTGIFEVLPISEKISELILAGNNAREIFYQARLEGMQVLREAGLEKVSQGITSLTEINRVINTQ